MTIFFESSHFVEQEEDEELMGSCERTSWNSCPPLTVCLLSMLKILCESAVVKRKGSDVKEQKSKLT